MPKAKTAGKRVSVDAERASETPGAKSGARAGGLKGAGLSKGPKGKTTAARKINSPARAMKAKIAATGKDLSANPDHTSPERQRASPRPLGRGRRPSRKVLNEERAPGEGDGCLPARRVRPLTPALSPRGEGAPDTHRASVNGKKTATRRPRKTVANKPAPRTTVVLGHVFQTLYRELDKLDTLEGNKSQDRERASRSLSQYANTLERAVRMQRDLAKTKKTQGVSTKDKEMLAHAEDLRRVIAERIQKLKSERDDRK